jgi:hypothetical protein
MAVKKATTTDDLAKSDDPTPPSLEEQVARVGEVTDAGVVADVAAPKMVKLKAPTGAVTEVPEGIVAALLDSGYKKK